MAIVAVLRDLPIPESDAAFAYLVTALASLMWCGLFLLAGAATHRMVTTATLRQTRLKSDHDVEHDNRWVISTVRGAFISSVEWVTPQHAPSDVSMFEGTAVLWFLPLDVTTTVTTAVVSSLPLSRSAALCIGANVVNAVSCALMLVAATRRPFTTAFATVHSIVSYLLLFLSAGCGLGFVVTASSWSGTAPGGAHLLLAISYLSGGAAVLSCTKAVVDSAGIIIAARNRLLAVKESLSQRIDICEALPHSDEVELGDEFHLELPHVNGTSVDDDDEELGADYMIDDFPLLSHQQTELIRNEADPNVPSPLCDLLDAYQQHSDSAV